MHKHLKYARDGVLLAVTLSPSQLGAQLAREGSAEQSNFLSAFLDELRQACGSDYNSEMQLLHIRDNLDPADRELLKCLTTCPEEG